MSQKSKTWNPFENKLFRYEEQQQTEQLPKESIPTEAVKFYNDFGPFIHPRTVQPVERPTGYQIDHSNDKSRYKLIIKSQKVGESSWQLRHDFLKAITTAKGKDILIIAQTQYHANEHLLTLKTDIINSTKYAKYLIRDPSEFLFREQKTKVREIQIKNPDNALRPSRIIALGASEGAVWSWKNVAHVHMSDIAANDLKDDWPLFAAAFSRLANTNGTMYIETPPRGPRGTVFEIYQQSLTKQETTSEEGKFKVFHVTAQDGVKAGLIEQSFLDDELARLGPVKYAQTYGAQFVSISGNLFNQGAIDKAIQPLTDLREMTEKYMAVDLGYVTSKFAIMIGEWEPKLHKIRILVAEEIEMPKYEQMLERLLRYKREYKNILNIMVDATNRQEFAMSLKTRLGENDDWRYVQKKMQEYKGKRWDLADAMTVVPIIFNLESKGEMASHARRIIEDPRELLAIDPKFNNLQIALRSAVFDDRGQLDKELSPHNDILDAFLMLLTRWKFRKIER
jgi:hypothetical protein